MVAVTAIVRREEWLKKPFSRDCPHTPGARQQSQLFSQHLLLPSELAAAQRSKGAKILPCMATGKPQHWGRSRSSGAL